MERKISIKPSIEGGQIVGIEVEEVNLPLKSPVPLTELSKLVEAVEIFFQYVDVEKLGETIEEEELPEWKDEDLREFVIKNLRDSQALALKVLIDSKEVTREEYIETMKKLLGDEKFRGWSLGGLLAGITMKSKSWGYESPYTSEWRTEGNEWKCYYWITRDRYVPTIREALKERK
jgi:hypothetical protein